MGMRNESIAPLYILPFVSCDTANSSCCTRNSISLNIALSSPASILAKRSSKSIRSLSF